jgi:hypothetical protein
VALSQVCSNQAKSCETALSECGQLPPRASMDYEEGLPLTHAIGSVANESREDVPGLPCNPGAQAASDEIVDSRQCTC